MINADIPDMREEQAEQRLLLAFILQAWTDAICFLHQCHGGAQVLVRAPEFNAAGVQTRAGRWIGKQAFSNDPRSPVTAVRDGLSAVRLLLEHGRGKRLAALSGVPVGTLFNLVYGPAANDALAVHEARA